MKMTSLKRNRRSVLTRLRVGTAVVVLMLFVTATFVFPMPRVLTQIGFVIARPVLFIGSGIHQISTTGFALLQSKRALVAENRRLTQELQQLSVKLLDRNLLKEENLALKESLGRSTYETLVYAPVLVKPNKSPYDVLILDGGYEDSISVGDYVLSSESVIIGEIVEVGAHLSRARLFSTSRTVTPVVIAPQSIPAEAVGRGNGNFEIKISRDIPVAIGDEIIAPGLSPRLFGVVEDIFVSPTDSLQTLIFRSPVTIAELGFVFVVTHDAVSTE